MNTTAPCLAGFALALLAPAAATARPIILEENQRLLAPQAGLAYFADSVAIDGDWALATALRSGDGSFNYPYQQLALLYRRVNGSWRFERVLVDDPTDEDTWNDPSVAMRSGLAAVSTAPLRTFQLVDGAWFAVTTPFPAPAGGAQWAKGLARISGSTLLATAGRCQYGAVTADRTADGWTAPQAVAGNTRDCSLPNYSSSLDVDGDTLVMTNPQENDGFPPSTLRIYGRGGPESAWQLTTTLPTGEYGRGVALRGDELFVGGWSEYGTEVYRRTGSTWIAAGHLPTLSGFTSYYDGAFHIARNAEFVLQAAGMRQDLSGAIAVYRRSGETYEQVALLTSSLGEPLGPVLDISGRTVIVGGNGDSFDEGRLYFFELPADLSTPEVLQEDFEDGEASGWQASGGRFDVARRGVTRIWRQSDVAGLALAVAVPGDWTTQSVTADIRPTAFAGADRWFGLATRYADAANYYYVTLRSSGSVQLRRMRQGRFTTLATRAMPVVANGNYQVRLESVGSRHRVFVNGQLLLQTFDDTLARGRAALLTFRTAADFDNVLITPGTRTTLYDSDILNGSECPALVNERELRVAGAPQWDCANYTSPWVRQSSATGSVRAAVGPVTGDQVVESRVYAESFTTTEGIEPWVGVITRYTDAANHYFLALRGSDTLVLGRVVNGASLLLDSVTYANNTGAWYQLRLDAVGDHLRGYVNGVLRVEARDSTLTRGISGLATEHAAARFDYLRVYQP